MIFLYMVVVNDDFFSANDVEMLKASSVSIGVAGREGGAASREADFAVDVCSVLRHTIQQQHRHSKLVYIIPVTMADDDTESRNVVDHMNAVDSNYAGYGWAV